MKCIQLGSLLLISTLFSATETKKTAQPPLRPVVHKLHVSSHILYRFAVTEVTCVMFNQLNTTTQTMFIFNIPKPAFVTSLSVEYGGAKTNGEISPRTSSISEEEAKNDETLHYSRNTNTLRLPFTMSPGTEATFRLNYQQIIPLNMGQYEYDLHLDPGGVISDLQVEVQITEPEEIFWLNVPKIISNYNMVNSGDQDAKYVKINRTSPNAAMITYMPNKKQQIQVTKGGVKGQFSVHYKTKQAGLLGSVQIGNGFFTHFFRIQGLKPMSKDIVFVLDTSGSMAGKRLTQLKDAMHNIVDNLNENDRFNIITFDTWIRKFRPDSLAHVTKYSIRKAKEFIQKLKARRMTDMNRALLGGIKFLSKQEKMNVTANDVSIIMFLTDGRPTEGVTNTDNILQNVREVNKGNYHIHSISFGNEVDHNFLQVLALQNGGMSKRLYADSDASTQLQNIHLAIKNPVLKDVHISYSGVRTKEVTRRRFGVYYEGSEIVISGKLRHYTDNSILTTCVRGRLVSGRRIIRCPFNKGQKDKREQTPPGVILEKLWVHVTLQQQLEAYVVETNQTKKQKIKQDIFNLSLKYNLLTDVTQLSLPNPNGENLILQFHDTDSLKSQEIEKLRGRGWQERAGKAGKNGKRRRWKRPRNYRLHNKNKKQRMPKQKTNVPTKTEKLQIVPVLAATTLDGASLCMKLPTTTPPGWYKILFDRGLQVRAMIRQYNGSLYLAATDIIAANLRIMTSQYAIRVNRKATRWGQSLRDAGVTVTEDKVLLEPFDGVSVEIHRVASNDRLGGRLLLLIGETASLTGRQTGLLAGVNTWTIQEDHLVIPKVPSTNIPVSGPYTVGVQQVSCYRPSQDLLQILGKTIMSYRL